MRDTALAAVTMTTHVDDILGCGKLRIMEKVGVYLTLRFGTLEIRETTFTHVVMELSQSPNFSIEIPRKVFAAEWELSPASTEFRNQRRRPAKPEEVWSGRRKLGELRWLVTAPRPDIGARLAVLAVKVTDLHDYDIFSINASLGSLGCRRETSAGKGDAQR